MIPDFLFCAYFESLTCQSFIAMSNPQLFDMSKRFSFSAARKFDMSKSNQRQKERPEEMLPSGLYFSVRPSRQLVVT
jgi:hypothetical protein